jgi:putative PEP-CTERM system histidine kinase
MLLKIKIRGSVKIMEFASVTFTAYFSAAIVATLLTIIYFYQFCHRQRGYAFTLAAALHTLYLAAIVLSFSGEILSPKYLPFLECLHYNGWVLAIALSLRNHSNQQHLPPSLQLLFGLGWPLTVIVLIVTLVASEKVFLLAPWCALVLAVISLVSVEQLYRYAAVNDRQIKLLCVNLGAIFIYDVYRYTHLLIFQEEFYPPLWQSRAAVSIVTCLFMALGGLVPLQQSTKTANFNISRPIAFYTTSLVGISILITLFSVVGYYIQLYGGNWGAAIYGFALVIVALIMATVFVSDRLRLQLSVFINKHLFHHKYDYRSEWLRIINYLAQPAESSEVNERAFFAVASTTHAPGGAIWLLKQGFYEPVYQLNLSSLVDLQEEPANSPFCRELLESEWVYFPDGSDNTAISHNNNLLPSWARSFPNLWLIFPLIVGEELVGFMALTNPQDDTALNWEDLDLLKTIGRQLASYLKRYQQAEQLAESKQFDTYNKLVAFIIHDLNNLIAQQALMLKNAERHKDNPAFVEDAFKTISNSVDRMNNLLKKLRRDESDLVKRINITDVVEQAVSECRQNNLKINARIKQCSRTLNADQVRLVMTITNFIKNAQEATEAEGEVHVTLTCLDDWAIITIEDNGSGMDWDFIQNRLFKPFETTKSGKGMGIGVYLSREYISELKGTLNVMSSVGEGTTITISIPLNKLE